MIFFIYFMDEVDFFGDRIVIMVEGVVKCCGIFLFLKKVFGKYIKKIYFIFDKYLYFLKILELLKLYCKVIENMF